MNHRAEQLIWQLNPQGKKGPRHSKWKIMHVSAQWYQVCRVSTELAWMAHALYTVFCVFSVFFILFWRQWILNIL